MKNYLFNDPGFVQNALRAPELVRLILATNMTSQQLFIGGVILVNPISQIFQISKTFFAFHPVSVVCYISIFPNLLASFIWLTSYTI